MSARRFAYTQGRYATVRPRTYGVSKLQSLVTLASQRRSAFINRRRVGVPGAVLATRGFRPGFGTLFAGNRYDLMHEKKVSDIPTTITDVNTTGHFRLLHVPTQGTDYTNRIGRKTCIKSLYIRGYLTGRVMDMQNNECPPQLCRMIILIDLQPNGAVPTVADLLNEALPTAQLNLNNRDRFKIITDKEYVLDGYKKNADEGTMGWNRTIVAVKKYKKLNQEVIFQTNGGSIADITTGALYMFWIGSSVAGSEDALFHGSKRVRFMDD